VDDSCLNPAWCKKCSFPSKHLAQLRCSHSLLLIGYRGPLQELKRPERYVDLRLMPRLRTSGSVHISSLIRCHAKQEKLSLYF
jgi:hypothetical protein